MPNVTLYNVAGQAAGEIKLNDSVFGVEYNEAVIHQAVVRQMANERLGTHATLTRGLVRGGGKKPWRQKGTGRARVGSIRSPLWVGGGTVFGPTPRSHAKSMNRKARQLAVKSALSEKLRSNEIVVLDKIGFAAPKTKDAIKMLAAFHVEGKALIIDGDESVMNTVLSARNIPGVKAIAPSGINIYDLVHYTKLFITKSAVEKIEEVLA
ncbi:50S ribosomal protein L4 [Allisonella histaminiformans]|jgi:large subunit ribosomal protein L4|uniref:Large ribosomal subunit protein uL4 n=1 Tax=Allisonella histaminiformans TaxID=209880 RepID=A0A1G5V2A4_9FIRM|nr:50S ribosomal protein L4 [Allisonella histaminiformans]PWL47219.1 MAG: 50S ribosomal protein L4 [Veillonellaceae bacterium]MCI6003477.1 50S ribosomal protein L4 [Allisonella histaminiformans]MDD6870897.1 50S ribosomal protein L4 [Allisonella histaminiformans]MDY3956575.1 50S ribosomal protein L4 [Allisonella histaminiformans]MDY4541011.1 50S ribosomal protein L4 [Allisonella histaminiformans]